MPWLAAFRRDHTVPPRARRAAAARLRHDDDNDPSFPPSRPLLLSASHDARTVWGSKCCAATID